MCGVGVFVFILIGQLFLQLKLWQWVLLSVHKEISEEGGEKTVCDY